MLESIHMVYNSYVRLSVRLSVCLSVRPSVFQTLCHELRHKLVLITYFCTVLSYSAQYFHITSFRVTYQTRRQTRDYKTSVFATHTHTHARTQYYEFLHVFYFLVSLSYVILCYVFIYIHAYIHTYINIHVCMSADKRIPKFLIPYGPLPPAPV
jgi:hypothetical protein